MSKTAAIALAIFVGLIAISAPIAISIYWAWKLSFDEQIRQTTSIAKDVLRRSEESADQAFVVFHTLEAADAADPCSDDNIRLMGKLDLASEQVQTVGYIRDNTLLCSSYGRHHTPVGPPSYETARDLQVRAGVEFPILPGMKFLVVTHKISGYSAAIHPDLPLDVFETEPEVSVGVFSFASGKLIVGRGVFEPHWIARLGEAREVRFLDGENLVVILRSTKYATAAFASIPATNISRGLRHTAVLLVPVGVVAGVVLALAVLYLARLQLALPAVLKVALRRNEFFLNYQPIVDLQTRRWVGAEVLIRWRRPNGEMVRPDLFIAVAEETGLIQRVTERVMTIAGSEAHALFERYPDFHLAINLSAADLECRATIAGLKRLADETAARHGNLMVEATERGFMRAEVAREILGETRTMGIETAIDDFGTGYSSLSYLETFELDYLKIDKSFVDTLGKDAATSQVVPHIIEMAKALRLRMIAEGVETEEQAQFLRERGVQFAQGWLFAKPLPFEELAAVLSAAKERSS